MEWKFFSWKQQLVQQSGYCQNTIYALPHFYLTTKDNKQYFTGPVFWPRNRYQRSKVPVPTGQGNVRFAASSGLYNMLNKIMQLMLSACPWRSNWFFFGLVVWSIHLGWWLCHTQFSENKSIKSLNWAGSWVQEGQAQSSQKAVLTLIVRSKYK